MKPLALLCALSISTTLLAPRGAAAQDALPPLPPSSAPPSNAPAPSAPAPTAPAPTAPAPEAALPAAPPPVTVAPEPTEDAGGVPRANRGFQLHAGLGYTHPFGKISRDGSAMGDATTGQLMLIDLGLGGKIGRFFYIGAYLGFATGSSNLAACDKCGAASGHVGIEAQYFMLPDARWDPWIGYGVGADVLSVDTSASTNVTYSGFEFARLTAGVDARLTRGFGLGPYIGFSLAQYSDANLARGSTELKMSIDNRAVHGWFTVGLRFVIFP